MCSSKNKREKEEKKKKKYKRGRKERRVANVLSLFAPCSLILPIDLPFRSSVNACMHRACRETYTDTYTLRPVLNTLRGTRELVSLSVPCVIFQRAALRVCSKPITGSVTFAEFSDFPARIRQSFRIDNVARLTEIFLISNTLLHRIAFYHRVC